MKKRFELLGVCICLIFLLCACSIKSYRKISDDVLNSRKAAYEEYLKKTYPDETFTVKVWQEYGKKTGAAGLPDYEGYLIKQVVTDSKGNRFKVYELDKGEYSDDYKKVLDGWIQYDENGEYVY